MLDVELKDGVITVSRDGDQKEKREQHGLARTLINNMIVGVTEGYQKKLQLEGVGYRAEKKGKTLVMNLGYSHPVEMEDPEGITTEVPNANEIIVAGIDIVVQHILDFAFDNLASFGENRDQSAL